MCGVKIIFSAEDSRIRFAGGQLKKHEGLTGNDVWVEFPCNREDAHSEHGEHSFTDNTGWKISWVITADVVAIG